MNLKLLSVLSKKSSPIAHIQNKTFIARAVETINEPQNRRFLEDSGVLPKGEPYVFDLASRSKLAPILTIEKAPARLRQSIHYLVYHGSDFNAETTERAKSEFTFD